MFFNYEGGTYSLFILAILCTPSWSETNKHTSFLSNFEKPGYIFFHSATINNSAITKVNQEIQTITDNITVLNNQSTAESIW